jgi:hypothetical protein
LFPVRGSTPVHQSEREKAQEIVSARSYGMLVRRERKCLPGSVCSIPSMMSSSLKLISFCPTRTKITSQNLRFSPRLESERPLTSSVACSIQRFKEPRSQVRSFARHGIRRHIHSRRSRTSPWLWVRQPFSSPELDSALERACEAPQVRREREARTVEFQYSIRTTVASN